MRGLEDRPHGMAFYGTEAALFIDRIGMEMYPEPKPPDGGRRGARAANVGAAASSNHVWRRSR